MARGSRCLRYQFRLLRVPAGRGRNELRRTLHKFARKRKLSVKYTLFRRGFDIGVTGVDFDVVRAAHSFSAVAHNRRATEIQCSALLSSAQAREKIVISPPLSAPGLPPPRRQSAPMSHVPIPSTHIRDLHKLAVSRSRTPHLHINFIYFEMTAHETRQLIRC